MQAMEKMPEKKISDAEMETWLKEGERLDDLQTQGLKIIQRPDVFRFGTDSVLLADFADPRPRERAVDLGCGTGAIAMLMVAHQPKIEFVDAVEIQDEIADMAARSVKMNGLEAKMAVHHMDMRGAAAKLGCGKKTLVVCNPPYGRAGGALENVNEAKRIARHEGDLTPGDIAKSASLLLKNGGRFCVIYPAQRAFEMMCAMEENHLAPKRIRTVHGFAARAPKFVLLDAVKGAGSGLHWLPPLVMNNDDGTRSDEWKRIYRVEE